MTPELPASRSAGPIDRRQKWAVAAVFVVALLLCVWINGRWFWLHEVPSTGNEDLARHVAMALNFRTAVAQGQFLPRIQPGGEIFSGMPLFQYYGFFEGLAAWPFLKFGLGGLQAVAAAIVLLRWGAFATVYFTGRVLWAGPAASAMGGFAYILSPYIINNELSRVAIAEVHAHNLLPLCLLGWAFILRGRRSLGVIVIVLGMAGLALAHNIFFLYGAVLLGLLLLCSFPDWRSALALALGGLGGVLVTGPQWYPVLRSKADLVTNYMDSASTFYSTRMMSASGLWGWLRPYVVPMGSSSTVYYFTFAWWTLPAAGALVWAARRDPARRPALIALLAAGAVFFLLSLPPVNFWAVLPAPFAAVQFTYRLITFVALLSGLGLALAFPRLSWTALLGLVPVMILSQWPVIQHQAQLGKLVLSDAQIASAYASTEFICTSSPKALPSVISYSDGSLREKNLVGVLPGSGTGPQPNLQVTGYNESEKLLTLRLVPLGVPPQAAGVPAQGEVSVATGTFSIGLPINAGVLAQRIFCGLPGEAVPENGELPRRPIRLRSVVQSDEPNSLLLPADCLQEVPCRGYEKAFHILPAAVSKFGPYGQLCAGDGWLREDNLIAMKLGKLRLAGINGMKEPVRLYAAKPGEPDVPLTGTIEIPAGPFDTTLPLAGLPVPLRLHYSPFMIPHLLNSASPDERKLALSLTDDGAMLSTSGYSAFIVQTPMAYNRFWEALHDGKSARVLSDKFYHLCVELNHPSGTLTFRYRMPPFCWALFLAGLVLCGLQPWLWKQLAETAPSQQA